MKIGVGCVNTCKNLQEENMQTFIDTLFKVAWWDPFQGAISQ